MAGHGKDDHGPPIPNGEPLPKSHHEVCQNISIQSRSKGVYTFGFQYLAGNKHTNNVGQHSTSLQLCFTVPLIPHFSYVLLPTTWVEVKQTVGCLASVNFLKAEIIRLLGLVSPEFPSSHNSVDMLSKLLE